MPPLADRIARVAALAGVDLVTARELLVETNWAAEGPSASAEEFAEWFERATDEELAGWLWLMATDAV